MNRFGKYAASAVLFGLSQSSFALTPWNDGAPDLVIYSSGGAALNAAYGKIVEDTLAAPNSVDTFSDVNAAGNIGSRWQSYYFTGKANLGAGMAGKKIVFEKRTYGAAGYGAVPLVANNGAGLAIEHLNIVGLPATAWDADGGTGKKWKKTLNGANASTYLTKTTSDFGFVAIHPNALLKPATENYPEQVTELITGAVEADWPLDLKKVPDTFTIINTGGYLYGFQVTEDLYRVLQASQKISGSLPANTIIGHYTDAAMPSLSRNFLASIYAGKVSNWEQIKVVNKITGEAIPLTDSSILSAAGVTAPPLNKDGITPMGVGIRNRGTTTGAIAYARLLNYPATPRSHPPAAVTSNDDIDAPIVKATVSLAQNINLLSDWQTGANVSGLNPTGTKVWGFTIHGGDADPGATAEGVGGRPWRYIKIDGAAPTIENVAAGTYPYWGEGTILYRTENPADSLWSSKAALIKTFADDMGSPALLKQVNTTLTFGVSGAFATTKDPRGFQVSIPFNPNNPVVALSHVCAGSTKVNDISADIVPVADKDATGGLQLQLK